MIVPLRRGEVVGRPRESLEKKFWRHVSKDGPIHPVEGQCWSWTGHTNADGYGLLDTYTHNRLRAHRVAYELLVNPIPEGLEVHHKCCNRSCMNPAHMELNSKKDHGHISGVTGGVPKGFQHKYCRKGHLLDDTNRKRIGQWDRCKTCYTNDYRRRNAEAARQKAGRRHGNR